jgi:TP901 family phage tail tape measure protein
LAGSRKEYELLFKLKASLGGNFNSAFQSALKTAKELQGTIQKVNGLQSKINGFQKQSAAIATNKSKLAELTAEHEKLQREMSQTETPSESLRKKMERNERQIEQTTRAIEEQERQLGEMGDELRRAGVNTDNLEGANERLRRSYENLKKSQEEYARISAAQQKNNEAISQTKAQLGGVIGTAAALGAAIYAGPVKKTQEFEAQMSSVKSIIASSYGDSPAGLKELEKDMGRLNAIAKQMGATTKFTATESGQALQYMAMAGWKADQMIAGLPGIMNLAAASGEDLGQVSDIVTDALTAFGMKAEEAGHFADVLAVASSNANTDVAMMGATFQKVAPVAGALGYSVEDMSLGIGLMANASIKAEVAGTSLKTALSNMAKPTKQMKAYMDKYGISLTNTDGSMKSFAEVVDNLRSSLGGLSQVEQVAAATAIFGKESYAGMLAIVNASEEDFNKLSDSVNNAKGAAEQMAAIKLDNLEGDITLMKSAADGLQIAIGEALLPAFRGAVQQITALLTKATEWANANPELVQQIVKIVAGLLAFKAATLGVKLGFLELKGGVLSVQKVFALFKGKAAQAGVESIGLLGKLKTAGAGMKGYFGSLSGAFGNLFSGTKIGSLVTSLGGKLSSGILGAFSSVGGKISGIFGGIGRAVLNGPLGKLGTVIGKGLGSVKTFLSPVTKLLSTAFAPLGKLGSSILGPLGGIAGKVLPVVGVIGLIVAAVQILMDHLDEVRGFIEKVFGPAGVAVFDKVVQVISNIGETIKGIFSEGNLSGARDFINSIFGEQGVAVFDTFISIMQTVGGVIGEFIAFIDANVKPVIETLFKFIVEEVLPQIASAFVEWGPTITGIIQSIWTVVQTVGTAVMGIIQALMPTIQSLISVGLETIKSVVGGVLTAIQGLLDVFAGVFTGNWSQVWEGVKSIFSGVWESIKGIAKGAMNGIISVINGLIGGLNKLKIPDWVPGIGGQGINIPLIPQFAKGTPRTPDTFIAGEAGAELITNAKNRTVFTAAETGRIAENVQGVREVVMMAPALQAAIAAAQAARVTAGVQAQPATVMAGATGGTTIHIVNQPTIVVEGDKPDDLDEKLRRNNEDLMNRVDERFRQQADDERRGRYD